MRGRSVLGELFYAVNADVHAPSFGYAPLDLAKIQEDVKRLAYPLDARYTTLQRCPVTSERFELHDLRIRCGWC